MPTQYFVSSLVFLGTPAAMAFLFFCVCFQVCKRSGKQRKLASLRYAVFQNSRRQASPQYFYMFCIKYTIVSGQLCCYTVHMRNSKCRDLRNLEYPRALS